MTRWLLVSGVLFTVLLLGWRVLAIGWKAPLTFAEEKKASPALQGLEPRYRVTQDVPKRQPKPVLRYRRKA